MNSEMDMYNEFLKEPIANAKVIAVGSERRVHIVSTLNDNGISYEFIIRHDIPEAPYGQFIYHGTVSAAGVYTRV